MLKARRMVRMIGKWLLLIKIVTRWELLVNASSQIQHLTYNTPKVMSQGCLSPRDAQHHPHTLLLPRLPSDPSPEKDCENSSSTHADTDSLSSLDLPLQEQPPPLIRPRTQQEVRLKYLQRLEGDGLLSERPRKKVHHVVILDWDDTLLCTFHLAQQRVEHPSQMSPTLAEGMRELDSRAAKLLATALELANVHIVTNSLPAWLHYTARAFLPHTHKLIEAFHVPITSARAAFEDIFPADPQRWKTEAFTELFAEVEQRTVALNLVCIGDSRYEMEAADRATTSFEKRFVKTVKLKEKPQLEELRKQLLLVEERLRDLMRQTKSLTIRLEKK